MRQLSTHSPPSTSNQGQPAYLCQSAFLLISRTSFSHNSWALQWIPYAGHEPLRISLSLVNLKTGMADWWYFVALESCLEQTTLCFYLCNKRCFLHPINQVILQTLESQVFFPVINMSCLPLNSSLPTSVSGAQLESASGQEPQRLKHSSALNSSPPFLLILPSFFYNRTTRFTLWSALLCYYLSVVWANCPLVGMDSNKRPNSASQGDSNHQES